MRADIHDGQGAKTLRSMGRIQMRETNYLQIVKSGLHRTAGPYRSAMYGRRPRCKGKIGHFSEAFGCSHVFGLFRLEDYLCRDAAAVAAGPDVIR